LLVFRIVNSGRVKQVKSVGCWELPCHCKAICKDVLTRCLHSNSWEDAQHLSAGIALRLFRLTMFLVK